MLLHPYGWLSLAAEKERESTDAKHTGNGRSLSQMTGGTGAKATRGDGHKRKGGRRAVKRERNWRAKHGPGRLGPGEGIDLYSGDEPGVTWRGMKVNGRKPAREEGRRGGRAYDGRRKRDVLSVGEEADAHRM